MAGTLISGQDPGGAIRPVQVDDNGNLELVYVSGSTQSVNIVGSTASQAVVGDVVADAADNGSGPVKIGGIARTANPSAVGNADRVSATYDDLGRQVIVLHQVRDLVQTASVTATTGAVNTLLAGSASTFHDLVYVTAANRSSGAVNLSVSSATGGGAVFNIAVPANDTADMTPAIPIPQDIAADAWVVQNTGTDISNTTVVVSALFVKNV